MGGIGRVVIVTWAAGGNVVPAAGLARVLLGRGHEVHVLGPPALRARFEELGCAFRAFDRAREPHLVEEEVFDDNLLAWTRFTSGPRLADDVSEELDRAPVDAAIVDGFLFAGLAAAERAAVPTAALVHVLYQPVVEGQMAAQWDPVRPIVDKTRAHLGLGPVHSRSPLVAALWERTSLALACTPEAFDYPLGERVANVRYVGPIFAQPRKKWSAPGRPLVVVSFSTTQMRQGPALQQVVDALAPLDVDVLCTLGGVAVSDLRVPGNVTVRDWVPHTEVLAHASAVVTHAGLSTVMNSLASGVPLLCLPMGRDQPVNAQRVAALGLGRQLRSDSPARRINAAVLDVLSDPGYRERAAKMAGVIAGYGNGSVAAAEIEGLWGTVPG